MVVAAHGHRVLVVHHMGVVENREDIDPGEGPRTVLVEHHMAAADIALAGEERRMAVVEDRDYEGEHHMAVAEQDNHVVVGCAGPLADSLEVDHIQDRVGPHSLVGEGDLGEGDIDREEAADNPLRYCLDTF